MANKSFGMQLKVGTTVVAELYELHPPGLTVDDVDSTAHDDPDRFRRFISTVGEWGEVEFKGAVTNAMIPLLINTLWIDAQPWTVSMPLPTNPVVMTFNGFLKEWKPSGGPVDGKLEVQGKIKVSGPVTFTINAVTYAPPGT
jgi:hypothetical protein